MLFLSLGESNLASATSISLWLPATRRISILVLLQLGRVSASSPLNQAKSVDKTSSALEWSQTRFGSVAAEGETQLRPHKYRVQSTSTALLSSPPWPTKNDEAFT